MEENKEAPIMEESSEQPQVQHQDYSPSQNPVQSEEFLQSQEDEQDQQHLESQSSSRHSPSDTSELMSQKHPVLHGMLISPKKPTTKQKYTDLYDQPCSSKQSSDQCILYSSPSQGEKRRSGILLEQQTQSKQLRLPDKFKEGHEEEEEEEDKKGKDD